MTETPDEIEKVTPELLKIELQRMKEIMEEKLNQSSNEKFMRMYPTKR